VSQSRQEHRVAPVLALFFGMCAVSVAGTSCRVQPAFPVLTPVISVPVNLSSSEPSGSPQPVATGVPPSQGGPIEAGCSFTANELKGEPGAIFNISCPANCPDAGNLWGSDTYTGDSRICKAAVHAGAIPAAGGSVMVRIDPGRPAYRGSVHYGVHSSDYGSYGRSFTVLFAEGQQRLPEAAVPMAPQVVEAGCSYNANQIRAEVGTSMSVACPAGCGEAGPLWGTDVYTGDSGICKAAIHAGLIPVSGGTVVVILDPARPAYRGSLRNGIRSSDYGSYGLSFHLRRP
jgi:hypothetical protein